MKIIYRFVLSALFSLFLSCGVLQGASDIGFVDDIIINGREFDELPREIEFYPEDLEDGKVTITGILESEDENTPVESLHVEITTNGGESWSEAKGNKEWQWSFKPEFEKLYEFSLRVVKRKSDALTPKTFVTTPIVLRFKKVGSKLVTLSPLILKYKDINSQIITMNPIHLRYKKVGSKNIVLSPLVLKFKKINQRVF